MPLLAALTFLTVLPLPLPRAIPPRAAGAAVVWYPLVGYGLGGALALGDWALRHTALSGVTVGVALVAALALATGFLHLDGLIDTCDAVFAHRPPAERLAIARDPRAGAFGVVGVVLALLLKASLLGGSLGGDRGAVIVVFPALARLAMSVAVILLPAARGTVGLGGGVKAYTRPWMLAGAALIGIVPAAILLRWAILPILAGTVIGGGGITVLALRRLGGATGDVYGATCECAEIGALLAAALLA